MKLSLVVPCYNEEDNVEAFFMEVEKAFKSVKYTYEIIFVNDGSRDGTKDKLKQIYREHEDKVKVIQFSRNFGKEAAILAGLEHANGEYINIIDADLQQRPEIVVHMVRFLEENAKYDCVAAYQDVRKEKKSIIFMKNVFYKLINKVCEIDFHSGASDFRTFRRTMADAILDMKEYFRFSKGIFAWVGFETFYMPYEVEERNAGVSKWSTIKLFKYAMEGFISFTTFPLRIATYLGLTSSILAIIYLFVVIIQKLFFEIIVQGYTTIVVSILLLGGIQLLILGIIGEYLARIYIQGKNRPIYIKKEILERKKESKANDFKYIV